MEKQTEITTTSATSL